jgi:glycerol-3-phosphate acyltransferase PlsY
MIVAVAVAAAYLIGSIPFSYLVARAWGVADVRRVGSGNVGATNVMRSAGRAAGLAAFALDFAKGALAAWLALRIEPAGTLAALAAVAAVVGHMFPVWLRFQGGKGVATGAGAFAPLAPLPTAGALVVFLVVAAATRYVSLGSVAAALALAAFALASERPAPVGWAAALVAALVVWRHRSNLQRLFSGTERRLGQRG